MVPIAVPAKGQGRSGGQTPGGAGGLQQDLLPEVKRQGNFPGKREGRDEGPKNSSHRGGNCN